MKLNCEFQDPEFHLKCVGGKVVFTKENEIGMTPRQVLHRLKT